MRDICKICKESGGADKCQTCDAYQSDDIVKKTDSSDKKTDKLLDYTHISEILHSYESATENAGADNLKDATVIYEEYLSYFQSLSNESVYNFVLKKSSSLSIYPEELNNFIRTFPNYERIANNSEYKTAKEPADKSENESSEESETEAGVALNIAQADSVSNNTASDDKSEIKELLVKYKDYFDNVLNDVEEGLTLDDDQREAIVTDDDNCLIVAGAGAGKTTTITAKVKYLVEIKGIRQ